MGNSTGQVEGETLGHSSHFHSLPHLVSFYFSHIVLIWFSITPLIYIFYNILFFFKKTYF